jgi:hypothetical protein
MLYALLITLEGIFVVFMMIFAYNYQTKLWAKLLVLLSIVIYTFLGILFCLY